MPKDAVHPKGNDDKPYTVVVNTREKTVIGNRISYEELIALAYETPPAGEDVRFTVTYWKGHSEKPQGSLDIGESVVIKQGMVFDVGHTNRS